MKDLSNRPPQHEDYTETYNDAGTLLIPLEVCSGAVRKQKRNGTETNTTSERIARRRGEQYLRDLHTHRYTDLHVDYSQAILEVEIEEGEAEEEEEEIGAASLEAEVEHTMPNDKENPE